MTPEYVLNPLAIYSMARHDLKHHEKTAFESSLGSCVNSTSPTSQPETSSIQATDLTQTTPTDTISAGPMAETRPSMGWLLSELFTLPTSFDDLQTYMQLPLLCGNGGAAFEGAVTDTDLDYGGMGFGSGMTSASLGFSVGDPNGGSEGFSCPPP
ncbi:hypothetical protein BGZ63DRAFT_138146 [Mariannaea sp. PMI_226]|nr:hypothetical protein BGZ63DRAFT_138146 [Mariannaea sp. PMI_226]